MDGKGCSAAVFYGNVMVACNWLRDYEDIVYYIFA